MPDPIWIDDEPGLEQLARRLRTADGIAIDTEFLRERTYYPRLCVLQIAADREIWCIDTLALRLDPLVPLLEAPLLRKLAHAARQDLEALRHAAGRIAAPVFDTQVAAACAGLKPQIGYAELVRTLLGVSLDKAHTRTDWSKRPLSREQLSYAADDVRYLEQIAAMLEERVRALGRENWVREDCAALADPRLYESDPDSAWERLGGIARLEPLARARAKALAAWRERTAQQRNLPRAWILPDAAIYEVAEAAPADADELARLRSMPSSYAAKFAEGLLATLR
ncbi:MAG: HRDC domain-containing protein, partial [Gammaproteobacteria bacterium]|nr:HRDC domain-containing protein [Gammaproteobacteria bacterium]